ncbi:MAG: hypothetical protein QOD41_5004 [Cryptosporangiaceae bacterium]|nr:hypothetical protein [Cryptosporangiaceae bacterium]
MVVTLTTATRTDALCAAAVQLAQDAAREVGGEHVGDPLGLRGEGDRLVTHQFACAQPGYRGWYWSVTVARAPRAKVVTVSEIALLPGEGAILAPAWLPWSERLRPGDLGVGDLMPTAPDDDRLAPSYVLSDDEELSENDVEPGFGRIRVLSRLGRDEVADRWHESDAGPSSPIAKAAPAQCGSCGFYLPLTGSLGRVFGGCGNLFAPDDGRIVSADHGCGAHSEALVEPVPVAIIPPVVLDDSELDLVSTAAHEPGSVEDGAETEPFGHG